MILALAVAAGLTAGKLDCDDTALLKL